MSANKYILDANIFIQAKNDYYRFTVCPGFWAALIACHKNGRVCSIDRIYDELVAEGDRVGQWAQDAPKNFFKKTQDKAVADAYQDMVGWAYSESQFLPAAKSEFASVADGWLIAYAKVNGLVLVTHETYEPNARNRVKIPNVCVEFDVGYVDTFDMLEDLKAKFALTPRSGRRR
jgi:hypothetical protein